MQKKNSRRIWLALIFAITALALWVVQAQAVVAVVEGSTETKVVVATKEEAIEVADQNAEKKFSGFGFAPALMTSFDIGNNDRVDTAEIVGDPKLVRVTKDNNVNVGFGLEAHYFFLPPANFLGIPQLRSGKWGVGPYIGITLGSNDIIDTVSAGIMLGLRRDAFFDAVTEVAEGNGDSFNIGLGLAVDPDAQILGKGFHPNQAPPAGEDQVRFRTTNQLGIQLTFSYMFNFTS